MTTASIGSCVSTFMWSLGILAAFGVLSLVAYFVMIDVKPAVNRPVLDKVVREEIEALAVR